MSHPVASVVITSALLDDLRAAFPEALKKIAIAVECFHKASLVHDDIEDGDATRYGEETLHQRQRFGERHLCCRRSCYYYC